MSRKRSTGPNARPKDETIAQSGEGLPDDIGRVPDEITETDEAAARRSLDDLGKPAEQRQKREEKRREAPGSECGARRTADGGR